MTVDELEIAPSGPVRASLRPPSSKSITNRAYICAALATGESSLLQPLESDDTHVMSDSLQKLGVAVDKRPTENAVRIEGCGGVLPATTANLFIGNSGTSVRFLTAMLCLGHGTYNIDGVSRMRERPITDLLDALNSLGANAVSETGCPPVRVEANGLQGGTVTIRGNVSSQYLSGLLMAAPYSKTATTVQLDGELISRPYIEMTTAIMKEFGVEVESNQTRFTVPVANYVGREYAIEPDASAASYIWAAAAITGGESEVLGLSRDSLQGDVDFCDLLVQMGCEMNETLNGISIKGTRNLRGIDCDMSDVSDTAQTLSAVALFADGPTTIRGIAHNRHKETDRIGNLAIELRKFGAVVDEFEDGFRVTPPDVVRAAVVDTYDDHRIAMSLALPGLRVPGVIVRDPGCTAKTYPHFFDDLQKISVPVG